MEIGEKVETFLTALNSQSQSYGVKLSSAIMNRLAVYYRLLDEWNSRLHLVAPCTPTEFATRHMLESLFLLNFLPSGVSVIDVGSGGGLPLVPCLIARPDLRAVLIESSKKKSVFLREALKRTGTEESATVLAERFENLTGLKADFVTCRALDRFSNKLANLIEWSPRSATLLLYGGNTLREKLQQLSIGFETQLLPNSNQRFLFTVRK
jgi:16S rRNA (guanine527-N7)-methyltransferase